jgi:hypothetical protein
MASGDAAEGGLQLLSHRLEEPITDRVPEAVVDLLEAVDIEDDRGDRTARSSRYVENLHGVDIEASAVQQPGQRVTVGKLLEGLLAQAPRHRTAEDGDEHLHIGDVVCLKGDLVVMSGGVELTPHLAIHHNGRP